MNQIFTFTGYVLSVIDHKRICIRVDKDCIDAVSHRISNASDRTTICDTIVVSVIGSRFVIDHKWSELVDLIGMHLRISATMSRYSYHKQITVYDNLAGPSGEGRQTIVHCKGISTRARIITNKIT